MQINVIVEIIFAERMIDFHFGTNCDIPSFLLPLQFSLVFQSLCLSLIS